jgi:uncharacterized membrane-anchored protein YjiN (DUF445 family)
VNAPTLYGITAELNGILDQLEELGGEITPELEQALAINEEQFVAKAEDYGHAILNLKGMAAAAKAEKERLEGLQKFYENAQKRLTDALSNAMQVFGHDKVEDATMRLSLRHSTATEVDDIDQVPSEYKTTKVEVVADKTAIKKAIQQGEDVPGAHLVENVSLQIK